MRYWLILLVWVLLSPAAFAASDWEFKDHTDGSTPAGHIPYAEPGKAYETSIDSSGSSKVISVQKCKGHKILMDTVSATSVVVEVCSDLACTRSSPCHSTGTVIADAGCHEDGTAAIAYRISSASENDVGLVYCGGD